MSETQTTDPETETEQDDDKEIVGERVSQSAAPFEATIAAGVLEDFIAPLDTIAREFRLQLTDVGFFAAVVDPGNIACAVVELDESAFEHYRVDGEGGTIGLNIERITDLLDFAESDDIVSVALNPETMRLDIEFETTSASVACIDPDAMRRPPDIPRIDLEVDVSITGKQFARAVDLCDLVSDHCIMEGDTDEREWVVRADGDTDDVREGFGKDDLLRGQLPDDHVSMFSIDYLGDMVGPIPNEAVVRIRHGDEFPLKFDYEIAEGVDVRHMLAPRVEAR